VGLSVAGEAVSYVAVEDLSVGPCCLPVVEAVVTDFSRVNTAREQLGDRPLDGLLGSDILVARAAVLDYGAMTLYLKETTGAADGRANRSVASEGKGSEQGIS
jgi:hypothetical protein